MTPATFTQNQIEKYRQMSGEKRLLIGLELHELSCEIARDGIRGRYPEADKAFVEEQLHQRIRLAYTSQVNAGIRND